MGLGRVELPDARGIARASGEARRDLGCRHVCVGLGEWFGSSGRLLEVASTGGEAEA